MASSVATATNYPGKMVNRRVIFFHRERAERALGRPLPDGAEVHHVDGTKSADSPLVICQDSAYHNFLHYRMRIRKAGFDPDTHRRCSRCKEHKPLSEFHKNKRFSRGLYYYCRDCARLNQREYIARKVAKERVT